MKTLNFIGYVVLSVIFFIGGIYFACVLAHSNFLMALTVGCGGVALSASSLATACFWFKP